MICARRSSSRLGMDVSGMVRRLSAIMMRTSGSISR
jgi:hypothetical protein